jgi:hypothetical protein
MVDIRAHPEVLECRIQVQLAKLRVLASWTAIAAGDKLFSPKPMPWPLGQHRLWDDQGRPAWRR